MNPSTKMPELVDLIDHLFETAGARMIVVEGDTGHGEDLGRWRNCKRVADRGWQSGQN